MEKIGFGTKTTIPTRKMHRANVVPQQTTQISVSSILLDEDIYPRKGIDHRCDPGHLPCHGTQVLGF